MNAEANLIEDESPDAGESSSADDTQASDSQILDASGKPIEKEQDKISFDEAQQGVFDEAMGKKVSQIHDARRENEELKKRISEAESRIPSPQKPAIPDMPDKYDDNFDDKLKARDKAIHDAAIFDSNESAQQNQENRNLETRQKEAQDNLVKIVGDYSGRATKLGISESDLQTAGNKVAQFGLDDAVTAYILQEAQGPAITLYLSKNLSELEKLQGLSPMNAAVRIASVITDKASKAIKKTDAIPDPLDVIKGQGANKERGVKGATYE